MGRTLSKTVTHEVEVDVDFSVSEVIEFLEDEGYEVVKSAENCSVMDREYAKSLLQRIKDEYGGELIEADYWHKADINIAAGATVLILHRL